MCKNTEKTKGDAKMDREVVTKRSLEELRDLLTYVQGDEHRRAFSIPGYDAYVPSFSSGGADNLVKANGELERNSERDQRPAVRQRTVRMIYGHTQLHEFIRDDGTIVVIEYKRSRYDPGVSSGPPEICYPPEGGAIEDWEVDNGKVTLTDAEAARAEEEIYETPWGDDGPDPDYELERRRDDD